MVRTIEAIEAIGYEDGFQIVSRLGMFVDEDPEAGWADFAQGGMGAVNFFDEFGLGALASDAIASRKAEAWDHPELIAAQEAYDRGAERGADAARAQLGDTMVRTIEEIEAIGYADGRAAAQESLSDEEPAEGWDAWTMNAIGEAAFFALFGLEEAYQDVIVSWLDVPELLAAAQAYARGAQRGATEALAV